MSNKISACLVLYNEENIIKRCLESIKNVVDEIIVVHDGKCRDKTIEICRLYTDKIFIREHIGEAEPHRPFSFRQANGDWILQIDADEFLSEELKSSLKELIEDKTVDGYECLWPLWDGKKNITKRWPYKLCLFRKSKASFLGIPHYVTHINGKIKRINKILEHRPIYNHFTWKVFKQKSMHRARVQAKTYLKNYKQIEKYNYKGNDWPTGIKIRIKLTILLVPVEFFNTFFKVLHSGAYREGIIGYKLAIRRGLYKALMNYYLFRYKWFQKKEIE